MAPVLLRGVHIRWPQQVLLTLLVWTALQAHAAQLVAIGASRGLKEAVGQAALAEEPQEGTAEAVESAYDHETLRQSNKVLGIQGKRGAALRTEGTAFACDRAGGKCALCALTRGAWCEEYHRQDRIPWKPAPRGSKECPSTKWGPCNGVGNCHYDIGVCQCPAGWTGDACDQKLLRPCTNRHKHSGEPLNSTASHVDANGMDLDLSAPGWTASRCAGMCDNERAGCWCPPNTKYGRKPAPADAPPWVRYSSLGRPIMEQCKPGKVRKQEGGPLMINEWGNKEISIDDIMGPKGWCNADSYNELPNIVRVVCVGLSSCGEDWVRGIMCDKINEQTCLNQCSGHGECDSGYCRCFEGWYGLECARKKEGTDLEPGLEQERPWLKPVTAPVPGAALEPPEPSTGSAARGLAEGAGAGAAGAAAAAGARASAGPTRMRPLIYVYDMPPEFTTRMLQYSLNADTCGWRHYLEGNRTELYTSAYGVETYLHEMLAMSPHRTYDPEEADFFYVPVYYCCWMWPVNGWADGPWWGAPSAWHRYSNAANMWLAAKRYVQKHFPFWDRRGGRDHIWLTSHDEGACYMPTEIYNNSIMLTQWGRMDPDHKSNTAYDQDNYSKSLVWPGVNGGQDVRKLYQGHPCYDPKKDLVIPMFKAPDHYSRSPLAGHVPYKRDILLYFRGDVGKHRQPNYSRGVRQKLFSLAKEFKWASKYSIFIGDKYDVPGDYGEHLARSIFCAVAAGDGFSARFEDAVLHGCIPLIIQDHTHVPFESILDVDAFSLRIKEEAVNSGLPYVLRAISPEQIERMQRRMALVWHRYVYAHGGLVQEALKTTIAGNLDGQAGMDDNQKAELRAQHAAIPSSHPHQPVRSFPTHTDALSTIIQWLHSRIPYARGEAGGRQGSSGLE